VLRRFASFLPPFVWFCLGSPHRRICAPVVERALAFCALPPPLSLSLLFLLRPSRTILRLHYFLCAYVELVIFVFGQMLPYGFPNCKLIQNCIQNLKQVANFSIMLNLLTYYILSPGIGPNAGEMRAFEHTPSPFLNTFQDFSRPAV
jgi:hypothetical protein